MKRLYDKYTLPMASLQGRKQLFPLLVLMIMIGVVV